MKRILFSLILVGPLLASAASITVNNLSQANVDDIFSDLTANFAFSPLTPTASLGKVFGFEFGAIAGVTTTGRLDTVVKTASSSNSMPNLANALVFGRFSVPFGISATVGVLPTLSAGGASLSSTNYALDWSLTDSILPGWLLDIGLRLQYTNAKFSFSQTSPITTTADITDNITGYQVYFSKNLIFMQPYLGIGSLSTDGSFSYTGTSPFLGGVGIGQTATSKPTGTNLTIGSEFKMGFFKIGLEYGSLMGTTRYAGKMSFFF